MGLGMSVRRAVEALRRERQVPVVTSVPDRKLLDGKIALVTGGSGGIGMAIARRLLDSGAKVIITGTSEAKLEGCVRELGTSDGSIEGLVVDVSDVTSISERVNKAVAAFPERRIDILVNAAGIASHCGFLDTTPEEWDQVLAVNARGTFFVTQAVAAHMIEGGICGHILNVSSASALRPAATPYNVSKWAVRGMTAGMADVLAPYGITVNAIAPGPVATPMMGKGKDDAIDHPTNPKGRYATPEEIAQLAVYLVSDAANLVVGETVYITGGGGTVSYHR